MTGNDVRYMQYLIGINVDGSFGPATTKAVKDWQGKNGLVADGSVGPATQKKMGLTDFIVHIYDKDQVWFAGTKYGSPSYPLRTLKQWAELEKADKVYNLAFFNMSGGTDQYGAIKGRTVTYLKGKGYDIGYGGTVEKLKIDSNNICAGYKVGVVNGLRKSVSTVGKRCRNANGQLKNGRYFHVQSVTVNTEKELVDYMLKNYAVDLLLIQDAGGSTGFYDRIKDTLIAGEKEGVNGRAVASVVCVKTTDKPVEPKKKTVCLDAGHGVEEAGKRSPDSTYYEHEFTLDMAYKMKAILERHNVDVILTRKDKHQLGKTGDPDLSERVKIANGIKGLDLFVSLHSNAYGNGKEWTSPNGYVAYTSVADDKAERNKAAKAILTRVKEAGITMRPTPLAHSLFYVLRYTNAPAVLLEQGFHTNKEEVQLLKSDSYRNKLAIANCKGILDYLNIKYDGKDDDPIVSIPDNNTNKHWAQDALDSLVAKGIVVSPEAHKNLDATISRGEVFVILDKITR